MHIKRSYSRDLKLTFFFNKETTTQKCYQQIKAWNPVNVLCTWKMFYREIARKNTTGILWLRREKISLGTVVFSLKAKRPTSLKFSLLKVEFKLSILMIRIE